MEVLLSEIGSLISEFQKDSALQAQKSNKAAGVRARKASLELEKKMKTFRKLSLELQKGE